jgi:electron transfer flavoprotein alpha subunit
VVAARLSIPLIPSCLRLSLGHGEIEAICLAHGGRAEAAVVSATPAAIVMSPLAPRGKTVASPVRIARLALERPPELAVSFEGLAAEGDDGPDISRAERIVCVGRGLAAGFDRGAIDALAAAWDAQVAASRPMVDKGLVERSRQVGKSGRTVAPKAYLALGVSGAPEHLEGLAGEPLVLAVNTDERAPIFDAADVGVVGDATEFAALLTETLRSRR